MSFVPKIVGKVAITSDTHFNHGNIINYCDRFDFVSEDEKEFIIRERNSGGRPKVSHAAIDKMNTSLIANWNSVITKDMDVIHCGDIAWMKEYSQIMELYSKLNFRNLYVVSGNHDDALWKFNGRRGYRHELIRDVKEVKVFDSCMEMNVNGQHIFFSHYANRVWPDSHRGSWNLYGHTHNGLYDDPYLLSMDVGVDSAKHLLGSYRPFLFNEIQDIMKKKKFVPINSMEIESGEVVSNKYEYLALRADKIRLEAELAWCNDRRKQIIIKSL